MIPETNHDTEISIYYDFLEDQGIIVDRDPEDDNFFDYDCPDSNVGSPFGILVGGMEHDVGPNVGESDFVGTLSDGDIGGADNMHQVGGAEDPS